MITASFFCVVFFLRECPSVDVWLACQTYFICCEIREPAAKKKRTFFHNDYVGMCIEGNILFKPLTAHFYTLNLTFNH